MESILYSSKQSWKPYHYLEFNGSENSSERGINHFFLLKKIVNSSRISFTEPREPVYSMMHTWTLKINRPFRGCYLLPDTKV